MDKYAAGRIELECYLQFTFYIILVVNVHYLHKARVVLSVSTCRTLFHKRREICYHLSVPLDFSGRILLSGYFVRLVRIGQLHERLAS